MTEPHVPSGGRLEHPTVRSEPTDASFRWIMSILAGGIVAAVVIHVGVYWFFRGVEDEQARAKKSAYPLAPAPSTALPREPRLEQLDRLAGVKTPNIYEQEASRLNVLESYGPTSEGFMHIPIEQAMKLLETSPLYKLKARAEPSADQKRRSGGLVDAGESNSGRMFRGGPR